MRGHASVTHVPDRRGMYACVTSTLVFLGLAARSGVDAVRLAVGGRTITLAQRAAMRQRFKFLIGFAIMLAVTYGVYLITLRR